MGHINGYIYVNIIYLCKHILSDAPSVAVENWMSETEIMGYQDQDHKKLVLEPTTLQMQ